MANSYLEDLEEVAKDTNWQTLEDLSGGKVKDQTVYTSSMLGTAKECLWKYNLAWGAEPFIPQTRGLGAVRGRAIHQTVNRLHRQGLWKHWQDVFDEEWKQAMEDPEDSMLPWSGSVTEDHIDGERGDAWNILGNYADRERATPVIASECRIMCIVKHPRTKTAYRYTGKVDQVLYIDGTFIIRDLKSNEARPDPDFLMRATQPTGYGYSLRHGLIYVDGEPKMARAYPRDLIWYHLKNLLPYKRATKRDGVQYKAGDLRGDPEISIPRSEDDYRLFPEEVCRLIQIIRMGLFVRQETMTGCSMCRYSGACTSGEGVRRMAAGDLADMGGM